MEDLNVPVSNPTEYEYIGPKEILEIIEEKYQGRVIETSEEIFDWIIENHSKPKKDDIIICTFIINLENKLVIADRHSEHVQCANGKNVRSAGEIGFQVDNQKRINVFSITNQSTGYCPSAKSWTEVDKALKKISCLTFPNGFEPEFVFSYCPNCKTRQIVREDFYFCPTCEGGLLSEKEFQMKRKGLEFK